MWLIVIALLVWAAVAGVLGTVLKGALVLGLGIFFGGMLLSIAGYFIVRRTLRRRFGNPQTPLSPRSEGDIRRY